MSNKYYTSDGMGVSKPAIDQRIRRAKETKLEQQRTDEGFNFCEQCGLATGRLDCAHTISVDECQKTRRVELAWDVENIKVKCRNCHQIQDKLNLNP